MSANQYGRAIAAIGEALSWLSDADTELSFIHATDESQSREVIGSIVEHAKRKNDRAFKLIRKALKHIAEA
jgi:DNA-binding transcriptional MerR regulator